MCLRNSCQTEEQLLELKQLTGLEVLDLSGTENFTNEVAAALVGEDSTVHSLYIEYCPNFTDEGLSLLSSKLKVCVLIN